MPVLLPNNSIENCGNRQRFEVFSLEHAYDVFCFDLLRSK